MIIERILIIYREIVDTSHLFYC